MPHPKIHFVNRHNSENTAPSVPDRYFRWEPSNPSSNFIRAQINFLISGSINENQATGNNYIFFCNTLCLELETVNMGSWLLMCSKTASINPVLEQIVYRNLCICVPAFK